MPSSFSLKAYWRRGWTLQTYGQSSLYELFGDLVILRNLAPVDPRLPALAQAWREMGLQSPRTPRKHEIDYARAAAWFVRQARSLERPKTKIRELLFVGDTAMGDGNAYRNLAREGGWTGWCFIGAEKLSQPAAHMLDEDNVYLANRWFALADWLDTIRAAGARLDESTAVVVDMDKTAVAARGRNARPMDAARIEGVERTVAGLLGEAYDEEAFLAAYNVLNDPAYHQFTADNQDYLAYICLVLGAGLTDLESLLANVGSGRMARFEQFIAWANGHMADAPDGLQQIHGEVFDLVQANDPTPFKAFRRNEYLCTAARFGCLPTDTAVERMLAEQVCITQEVRELALWLRERGCLVLSMSDKPDEATLPTPELAAQGYQPLHRLQTVAVGKTILGPQAR
jgi:hypothetical protein